MAGPLPTGPPPLTFAERIWVPNPAIGPGPTTITRDPSTAWPHLLGGLIVMSRLPYLAYVFRLTHSRSRKVPSLNLLRNRLDRRPRSR